MSSENKEIWKKIEDYDYIVSNFGMDTLSVNIIL